MNMSGNDGAPFAGRTIFVVEDDALLALTVEDILSDVGATVAGPFATLEAATKGLEGLEGQKIAVGLLDVNIQGESSYAIADALAARGVPVLFATGYGAADWQHGDGQSTPVVIAKPYEPDSLVSALRHLMD